MVRLTIIGRVNNGMPLAQGLRYKNEEDDSNLSYYKHQVEFILKEISKGALPTSKMTIRIDHQYSFNIITNIRKQYMDTRTQTNLAKLNANHRQELDVATKNISTIIKNRRHSEFLEQVMAPQEVLKIWCSPHLEMIALRWTPITIAFTVVTVVFWASLTMAGYIFSGT